MVAKGHNSCKVLIDLLFLRDCLYWFVTKDLIGLFIFSLVFELGDVQGFVCDLGTYFHGTEFKCPHFDNIFFLQKNTIGQSKV